MRWKPGRLDPLPAASLRPGCQESQNNMLRTLNITSWPIGSAQRRLRRCRLRTAQPANGHQKVHLQVRQITSGKAGGRCSGTAERGRIGLQSTLEQLLWLGSGLKVASPYEGAHQCLLHLEVRRHGP